LEGKTGRTGPVSKNEMVRTNPFEFLQQVRTEVSKVTWPTRRETIITTIMVVVMSIIAAIFFLGVDWVLGTVVQLILGIRFF
jgi:preprotein translocase subunit SecE